MDWYRADIRLDEFKVLAERLLKKMDTLEEKIDGMNKQHNFLEGDELLDNQDLCLLLKASKRTLQRYRDNGVLPFHSIEGKVYYKLSDIHDTIRKSFQPASKKTSS